MMRLLKILGSLCAILYPLLVLWMLSAYREHLRSICLIGLPVLVLVCVYRWVRLRQLRQLVSPLVALVLFAAVAATDAPDFFKLYPIVVSALLLVHFASSLANPPTVIEQFARLGNRGAALPPEAVPYCRKVTWVWVGFFCFNITVSALSALSGSWLVWTWYNGCISYVLIGLLMAGEWCVRRYLQAKQQQHHSTSA